MSKVKPFMAYAMIDPCRISTFELCVKVSDYDALMYDHMEHTTKLQVELYTLRNQLDEARELLAEVRSPEPVGDMCIWKRIDAWLERNKK